MYLSKNEFNCEIEFSCVGEYSLSTYTFTCIHYKITPKPNWPGVGCMTSDLVCTSCTRGVQKNGAIGLVRTPIYRDFRVNHVLQYISFRSAQ